jgi:hypothetical protein
VIAAHGVAMLDVCCGVGGRPLLTGGTPVVGLGSAASGECYPNLRWPHRIGYPICADNARKIGGALLMRKCQRTAVRLDLARGACAPGVSRACCGIRRSSHARPTT